LIKVLVIDDDINMVEMLKLTLEACDFEVITETSPEAGIIAAQEKKPDTIILDYMMPVLNGMEVCQKIRKFSQVPILVLSVMDQPSIVAKLLDAGADDFLVKPVAGKVLQAHLRKLARRNPISQIPQTAGLPLSSRVHPET
jgi:DNA-binding response OmpR family regulator